MKKLLFGLTMAAAMLLPASAQDTQPAPASEPGKIQLRKENQQDRIAQGVKSGQLTAGETANLEHKETGLNQEIRSDRQANGKLTAQQKRQVNRQQNRLSRNIHRDKHNGKTQGQ